MNQLPPGSRDLVRTEFAASGCDGWAWAQVTGSPGTGGGVGGDSPVPTASMYKLHLLAAACRAIDGGILDPHARVTVGPLDGPRGSVGFGWFADPVVLSVRDLMRQMVMVSDNVAAHRLSGLLEAGPVDTFIADLGLEHTTVVLTARSDSAEPDSSPQDPASPGTAEEDAVLHVTGHPAAGSDPGAFRSLSTARELCRVMDWFWEDDGSDSGRRLGREVLGQQAWRNRIPSGFPASGVGFHGKTGTIGAFRGETAVVTVEGEPPVTVSVMARSARAGGHLPGVDTTIGRVARILVNSLRLAR